MLLSLQNGLNKSIMNKDLILREKLALQRTHLANQTALLAFVRTAMYFFVAGLSIDSFFKFSETHLVMWTFFIISFMLLLYGIANYFKNKKMIKLSVQHIGDYKTEYLNSN